MVHREWGTKQILVTANWPFSLLIAFHISLWLLIGALIVDSLQVGYAALQIAIEWSTLQKPLIVLKDCLSFPHVFASTQ